MRVGVNIYHWGEAEQVRLLLEGLRPWALAARGLGLSHRLWYRRFDARGPHVLALFDTTAEARDDLRSFLTREVGAWLERSPSRVVLDRGEIEQRHRQCRGTALCRADREPGLAANNTFVVFDHEAGGFPDWLGEGMANPGELWDQLDELTFWTLDHLERGSQSTAAVQWLAAVDRSLGRLGIPPEVYWRRHAATLIPPLEERLAREEGEVLAALPAAVGDGNRRRFDPVWEAVADERLGSFDVGRLVAVITADDGRPLGHRLLVLREVNHAAIGQLDQPTRLEIPLILYAWQRNLTLSPPV